MKSTIFCKNLKVSAGNCKMLQDSIKFLQDFAKFYKDSVMLKWQIFKVSLKSYKIVCTHETDSFLEEWFLVSSRITWDINTKSLNSKKLCSWSFWVHFWPKNGQKKNQPLRGIKCLPLDEFLICLQNPMILDHESSQFF